MGVGMRAGLGVGVGGYGQVWADMGKGWQVWMGQTDRAGWMTWEVGGCGYVCRSRGGFGWLLASLGRYGQRWAKVGRSGWVRLIGRG